MTALLGLDIGTTATKGVVLDPDRGVLASASRPADLISRNPGWAEEDPQQWWGNVGEICNELATAHDVEGVGVAGMVPCTILLDDEGNHLRDSIQQNDARAAQQVDTMREVIDEPDVIARTGSAITQQSLAPTLLWLQQEEPQVWSRTKTILGSYDYVVHRLTGERSVEENWALESGLYDFNEETWAGDILQACDCDSDLLPSVAAPSDIVGKVTSEASRLTGLAEGTPVTAGAADHVAAAFAAGTIDEGDLLLKLGGAGDILMCTSDPIADRRLFLDHHLVPGRWLPNGCMASSGSLVKWFQNELGGKRSLIELDAEAERSGAGARGIVALPYFLGEKTPIQDPSARGAFVGLHLGHERGDMFRAVLESVAFGFRHHVEVFAEHGFEPARVRAADGGAESRLWVEILAGVLGRSVERIKTKEGSALGAAFAAGIATGVLGDWREIERFVETDEAVEPTNESTYSETYQKYRNLYPALSEVLS